MAQAELSISLLFLKRVEVWNLRAVGFGAYSFLQV